MAMISWHLQLASSLSIASHAMPCDKSSPYPNQSVLSWPRQKSPPNLIRVHGTFLEWATIWRESRPVDHVDVAGQQFRGFQIKFPVSARWVDGWRELNTIWWGYGIGNIVRDDKKCGLRFQKAVDNLCLWAGQPIRDYVQLCHNFIISQQHTEIIVVLLQNSKSSLQLPHFSLIEFGIFLSYAYQEVWSGDHQMTLNC